VAGPDDTLRVFWWDRFDGLMVVDGAVSASSVLTETERVVLGSVAWSEPTPAPIGVFETVEEESVFRPIATMPRIVADAAGRAHAFWLDEADQETGFRPLMHSRLAAGDMSLRQGSGQAWSSPGTVAKSAVSFDVAADASGALHLAYVHTLHAPRFPAGIYYERSDDGATWSAPVTLHQSRYLRTLSSWEAHVRLAADGAGGVYVTWDDPRLERALFAHSDDGGATWQEAQAVGDPEAWPRRGRVFVVPGGQTVLLWEDARVKGMCGLYQAPVSELLASAEGTARRVLEELTACPQNERFLSLGEGQVLMVAGNGSDVLTLAAWDGSRGLTTGGERWSEPRSLTFRFMDPELGKQTYLRDLQAVLVQVPVREEGGKAAETLVVVGTGQNGDVWVTGSQMDPLELVFAPSPPLAVSDAKAEAEPSAPVNLSYSGAASSPVIVAGPDGTLRVLWEDHFDGLTVADGRILASSVLSGTERLMTSYEVWSEPRSVPAPFAAMPRIVVDAAGRTHAFGVGEADRETGAHSLMYSQMLVGGTSLGQAWSLPTVMAESAVRFDVATDASGALHLAYVRSSHTPGFSAGVYYRHSDDGGAIWSTPVALDTSRYLRLLSSEEAQVRLAADGAGGVYVIWDDPRLEQVRFAHSADGGATWQSPRTVGDPDGRLQRGRVVTVLGGQALLLWEDARVGGRCGLYQAFASELLAGDGGVGQPVLEELTACPQNERFLSLGEGQVLMVAGNGSDVLTLAAWDGSTGLTTGGGRWSEPRQLSFRFEDPGSGKQVYLGDLQAALVALSPNAGEGLEWKALIAVGVDQEGDVWVTNSQMGALKLVFAPPPPWSTPIRLSQEGAEAGWPAVALDAEGGVHVVWSQVYPELSRRGAGEGGPGTALLYARWDSSAERWSRAVEVVHGTSGEEMARQPVLLTDGQGMLHLVWSGGEQGRIFYRRARISEARGSGGWSPSQPLPAPTSVGSWPQIGMDAAGRLYVVYAVAVNEGRGIYLTRSDDGGETWSEPEVVFDAATAGWAMADHPALAVASDGTLHVAWVRGALPGTWPPQSIYYTRSSDGGVSWTGPVEVAGSGYDWPRLALASGPVHLLYAEAGGGGVWHRWSDAGGQVGSPTGWGTPTRVRDWEEAAGPFGLAADGRGTLHLVGKDAEREALLYSTWDGSTGLTAGGSHWSAAENFRLGSEIEVGLGVAAATLPQGGRLAVAMRALPIGEGEKAVPVISYTARAIPTVEVPPAPAPNPTPTVTPSPTPEPMAVPSPTPDPSTGSGQAQTSGLLPLGFSMDPLLLGGGLAALIVVGVLATWGFRRGR